MSLTSDPRMRQIEILRAIDSGARTYTDILPHSAYEHVGNVRRVCQHLVRSGCLETWKATKPRDRRSLTGWSHGPIADHFRITILGEERLAELAQACAPSDLNEAAS